MYSKIALSWVLFLSCFFLFACEEQQEKKAIQPPNIVLIVADDHGTADMSILNLLDDVHTPNLDALAQKGIRFTQAHATSPICSPSRMGIITGVHNQRFGTYWYGGQGIHKEEYPTIPELLKQKNYATGYIGKVHYGSGKFDSDPSNRNFPNNHGFDYFFGHTSARKHYLIHSDKEEEEFIALKKEYEREGQTLRKQSFWRNKEKVDTAAFSTEMIGNEAKQFIQKHKDEPFYLQVSFNAVHNFTHQLPEEYLSKNKLTGYHDWDPKTEEYYDWYRKGRFPNNPEGRDHYLGQLYYLDQQVGEITSYLSETGLDKNTLIIYIGDNGGSTPIYANNTPLRGSKYLLYEGGTRVPLIISYPDKFPEAKVLDNTVSAMDLLPTICSIVGIDPPKVIDGLNLHPLLTGTDLSIAHDTLFFDTGHERSIKTGNWKWHEATNDQSAKYEMVDIELGQYLRNLESDISETKDFSESEPEMAKGLKKSLERWQEKIKEGK